jgi:hypothetical protein
MVVIAVASSGIHHVCVEFLFGCGDGRKRCVEPGQRYSADFRDIVTRENELDLSANMF